MKEFNTKDFKEFIEELFDIKLTSCQEIILDMLCKNNTEESVSWNEIFDRKKYAKRIPVRLDLKEPPCRHCKFWDPRILTDQYGEIGGIRCCTSKDMFHDFSCYKYKKEGDKD